VLAVARKEWRFRARSNFWFLVLVQPAMFCLVWGFCASLDLRDVHLAVLDESNSQESRTLVRRFDTSGAFELVERATSFGELEQTLADGTTSMALVVPPAFPRELSRGRAAPLEVITDGTDPTVSTLGVSYALATAEAAIGELRPSAAPRSAPASSLRAWYNPSLRSRDLLLIGAICYNLVWLFVYPASALIQAYEGGMLAALGATPLGAGELWLGIVLSNVAIALLSALTQIVLLIVVAGVPMRGDPSLLLLGLTVLALIHINLGCVLPRFAKNNGQVTLYGLVLMFLMMSISGFLIPSSFLPSWTRPIAELVPLHHGLVFVRAVFLKGVRADALAHQLTALSTAAAISSVVALGSLHSLLHRQGGAH
jgi:ABC-2 type transport system permease protein